MNTQILTNMNTDTTHNGYREAIADIGERLYRTAMTHPSVARTYAEELQEFIDNSAITRLHQVRRNLESEMMNLDAWEDKTKLPNQLAILHKDLIDLLAKFQELPKGYQHLLDTSLENPKPTQ